jgi:4-hydroxy-tetrahydrodipicolinate synthase
VTFSDELYARIAALPNVASIKIPGVPADPAAAEARVNAIRDRIPESVGIGVSGDSAAATGLNAGCDVWYSVIGGTLPETALRISRAALSGDHALATAESERLEPLWALFRAYGSYRVTAAIGELLGLVAPDSLPRPVRGLTLEARTIVTRVVDDLDLRA